MFKARKKINKSFIAQSISHLDNDFCELILASELLGEGVYSIECTRNSVSTDYYFVTPSFFREEVGEESFVDFSYLRNNTNDLNCYSIVTTKPSFMPIYTENFTTLLQNILLLQSGNNEVFVQLLFNKLSNNWKHNAIDQYAEYLRGNNYPSVSRIGRSAQRSFLKVVNKTESKRNEIPEISQKILDDGYRFELNIISLTNDKVTFESELNDVLKEYDFFNELSFIKARNNKHFIDNYLSRNFTSISRQQVISEKELISLIVNNDKAKMTNGKLTLEETLDEIKEEVIDKSFSGFAVLPIGIKKERDIDQDLVVELPSALRKAKAIRTDKVEVIDVELGATVQRITFKIPKGHVYSDIRSKYEDIKSTLGTEISIIQGNEPNTITFLIPCKDRDIIYLKELIEDEHFQEFASKNALPFICGIDMYNKPVYKCLTNAPHLLVAGATNSGKSVFVNTLLITLILLKNPNELRIFLVDPKKVEFSLYKEFAHVEDVITDMDKATITLEKLIVEMENRYDKFAEIGVRKIDAYNNKSKQKIPYIICAIDEYNDLKMTNPEVEEKIERLGQKSRAAGIHLILATQRPDKDVMSGVLKTNIPSRVSFKLDNSSEYRTVFGTGIPFKNLLGFGDGVIKFVGQSEEFIRFQAPVITLDENEEEETFNNIKMMYKGESVKGIELSEVNTESDLDKLKRIIANTGEVRFSKLREQLGKGSNTVKELMEQLVREGWLSEPESKAKGYQLTVEDEQLQNWREF